MPKDTPPYNRYPKLKLKYNFENGGKLPVRKEGESDSDYYARWTPEDYKLLNEQILKAELDYGTLNQKFLDEQDRVDTVNQDALKLARELAYNQNQWADKNVVAGKGLEFVWNEDTEKNELRPRMISIDNPQDWEAIGMEHVNDPNSFVNNLTSTYPDPKNKYLYDWDKEEYILDKEGNKQPVYQRGMGCIGAMCGIYNTAGATQVSDFPTGFGKNVIKAGDPIFKQMSNKFLDADDYAGMKAMGFVRTDSPKEGSVMRIAEFPGSPYSSHSMMVNKIIQNIDSKGNVTNKFDWNSRENVIENPGSFSLGVRASKAPSGAYHGRESYWDYVGNTPQYEKEATIANEELKRLQALQSSSFRPTKLDIINSTRTGPKETNFEFVKGTPYVPKTRKEKKEFANIPAYVYPLSYSINNRNGGSLAPIIPTYYKSKGTPIYRDTTDAPPRMFDNGGKKDKRILPFFKNKYFLKETPVYKGKQNLFSKTKSKINTKKYPLNKDQLETFLYRYNEFKHQYPDAPHYEFSILNPYKRGGYLNKKYKYGGFSR
tara:strand:- start:2626 stop:4257 length:1632 start_codon:yes stop_codon:yes gene_type:complete